jgi:phytanoyl-CoA hydroxylase
MNSGRPRSIEPAQEGFYSMLTAEQIAHFHTQGYLVMPAMADPAYCRTVIAFAQHALSEAAEPIEYEADTHYPGAPNSREAEGGQTARRILQAAARSPLLMNWARDLQLKKILQQILGDSVYLSQAHHNCIMTKQPRFSSRTGWHRDSRYWHFKQPELVSVWLALGREAPENGCLKVLPSSHLWLINSDQLDADQFLRTDSPENETLLAQAINIELHAGDVLFFHSNLFHEAGNNQTTQTKYSLVFTYRAADNPPLAESRSASFEEIAI